MLCAPPFEKTPRHIMDGVVYNKGIKENGGIFNHPQAWAVMAECMRGNGDQAYEYYRAYMPSAYNTRAELREIEPYVHSQTTYATISPNAGKSRVPWLTGTHPGASSWPFNTSSASCPNRTGCASIRAYRGTGPVSRSSACFAASA